MAIVVVCKHNRGGSLPAYFSLLLIFHKPVHLYIWAKDY